MGLNISACRANNPNACVSASGRLLIGLGWLPEGAEFDRERVGTAEMVPRKLATIVTLTSEMLVGSNAEALVTDLLARSVGLALDSALFDFAAADLVRPAASWLHCAPRINEHRRGGTRSEGAPTVAGCRGSPSQRHLD